MTITLTDSDERLIEFNMTRTIDTVANMVNELQEVAKRLDRQVLRARNTGNVVSLAMEAQSEVANLGNRLRTDILLNNFMEVAQIVYAAKVTQEDGE